MLHCRPGTLPTLTPRTCCGKLSILMADDGFEVLDSRRLIINVFVFLFLLKKNLLVMLLDLIFGVEIKIPILQLMYYASIQDSYYICFCTILLFCLLHWHRLLFASETYTMVDLNSRQTNFTVFGIYLLLCRICPFYFGFVGEGGGGGIVAYCFSSHFVLPEKQKQKWLNPCILGEGL